MDSEEEWELRSLLTSFGAHNTPTKHTPAKARQRTPRSARSSTSAYETSQIQLHSPLPSPLAAYATSSDKTETRLSDQLASTVAQPVQLSKEEQADAVVLSLIQDRATGVDWDTQPHVSNLGSVFHLEHDEAIEILQVWYPCINERRLHRAVQRHRHKMEEKENEEMDVKVIDVKSMVGTSFDSAIVLDDEQELKCANDKTGISFDSAIVISYEDETGERIQDAAANGRYGRSSSIDMRLLLTYNSCSVETAEVLPPPRCRTPSPGPGLSSVAMFTPRTPTSASNIFQRPTPITLLRPLVQHSREYSQAITPKKRPDHRLYLTGSPGEKRKYTVLENGIEVEPRASKVPRKGVHALPFLKDAAPELPKFPGEEMKSTVLEKTGESYPSPAKTPVQYRTSFLGVDRSSPSPQQRTVKATPTKAKRTKFIKSDARIEIPDFVLKAQREDPSEILLPKGASLLPRDPMVLALLSERNDKKRFIANVFGAERRLLWAPELRGINSVDEVLRCGRYKRGLEMEDE